MKYGQIVRPHNLCGRNIANDKAKIPGRDFPKKGALQLGGFTRYPAGIWPAIGQVRHQYYYKFLLLCIRQLLFYECLNKKLRLICCPV